jgi:hypothetical protein
MTDTVTARPTRGQNAAVTEYAPPRERKVEESLTSLAGILGRHTDNLNSDPVRAIAASMKALTYDEAQSIGSGLADAISQNKDKDSGFDFSNSPIKLAPVLTHLIQTWASAVVKATEEPDGRAGQSRD